MKYFLWINGKQDGPYDREQIREMLERGSITAVTLGHPEDGTGEWSPISKFPGVIEPPPPPKPVEPPPPPTPAPPPPALVEEKIENTGQGFFAIGILGSFICGIAVIVAIAHEEPPRTIIFFFCGGLVCFAQGLVMLMLFAGLAEIIRLLRRIAPPTQ